LVIASASDKKLKVWSADRLVGTHSIPDHPISLCTFYALPTDGGKRKPRVAVAAGDCVFIYAAGAGDAPALRPFYKFTNPPLGLDLREAEVWRSLSVNALTSEQAFHTLTDLKDTAGALLSERACSFTEIDDAKLRERFVRAHATSEPPTRVTSVTALGSIKQTSDDADAVSVLFFATETGELHVLSPDAKQIGKTYRLPSPAAFVTATGRTNSEYKILCACRDGRVYLIENGFLLTETVFELETQVCGLCVVGNDVVVGCADHTAHAFAIADHHTGEGSGKKVLVKGQKSYGIYFPAPIKTLCVLDVNRQKRFERLLVGLGNGEVRVYHENVCVLTLATGQNDPPTGLLFARLGREENALAIVTKNGSVTVKIMPRRADLSAGSAGNGNNDASNGPEDHSIPLAVPKKTKVYVENAARERLVGKEMHQTFQKDLQRLRLNTARARVAALRDGGVGGGGGGGVGNQSTGVSVRLDVSVQGLGPVFKIVLTAVNVGTKPLFDACAMFAASPVTSYALEKSQCSFPALLPGVRCCCEIAVEAVVADDAGAGAGTVSVYVCEARRQSAVPIVSAVVRMPVAEFFE